MSRAPLAGHSHSARDAPRLGLVWGRRIPKSFYKERHSGGTNLEAVVSGHALLIGGENVAVWTSGMVYNESDMEQYQTYYEEHL
jgi:hypothetical protein